MRIVKTFALAVLVALVVTAALTPVQAKCTSSRLIQTNTADGQTRVYNPATFDVVCLAGYAPYSYYQSPVSPAFEGIFWALGTGDVALGLGDDSGSYAADGSNTPWFTWEYYPPGGPYPGYTRGGQIFANWGGADSVDGCVPTGTCECVLLTDEVDGVGYFALATGLSDANGNLNLTQSGAPCGTSPGDIVLAPIPTPTVTRIDMDMVTKDQSFQVTASVPAAGIYEKDGCVCGPLGWKLYQRTVPRGNPAPVSRNAADWEMVVDQTPFGATGTWDSACGDSEVDIYLAVGLAFADGFPGPNNLVLLSANDGPYLCGPTMADPTDLQPKIRRQLRDQPRTDRKR
jgi:hypothetical protein